MNVHTLDKSFDKKRRFLIINSTYFFIIILCHPSLTPLPAPTAMRNSCLFLGGAAFSVPFIWRYIKRHSKGGHVTYDLDLGDSLGKI